MMDTQPQLLEEGEVPPSSLKEFKAKKSHTHTPTYFAQKDLMMFPTPRQW